MLHWGQSSPRAINSHQTPQPKNPGAYLRVCTCFTSLFSCSAAHRHCHSDRRHQMSCLHSTLQVLLTLCTMPLACAHLYFRGTCVGATPTSLRVILLPTAREELSAAVDRYYCAIGYAPKPWKTAHSLVHAAEPQGGVLVTGLAPNTSYTLAWRGHQFVSNSSLPFRSPLCPRTDTQYPSPPT